MDGRNTEWWPGGERGEEGRPGGGPAPSAQPPPLPQPPGQLPGPAGPLGGARLNPSRKAQAAV